MYTFKKNINVREYEEFLNTLNIVNFMQEPNWAKVKNNFECIICGVYENNSLIAATQVLIRKIKKGITLFYIPRGFLMDLTNKDLLSFMTKNLKELAHEYKAYVIKIDPLICKNEFLVKDANINFIKNFSNDFDLIHNNLINCGYKHKGFHKEMNKSFQPRYQMAAPLIDKDMNLLNVDDFLKTLKSKHRYYIGDFHTKRGITFEITNDINKVDEFVEILKFTEDHHNISLRDKNYFKRLIENFPNRAYLIFGKINLNTYMEFVKNNGNDEVEKQKIQKYLDLGKKEITVSSALLLLPLNTKIKTSEYLYAGNNLEFSKLNVSIGVCFEAIKISINNQCHYCNLGGVDGNLKDPLSIFKSKFNAVVLEFIGEYDLVVNKFIYTLANVGYPILKKLKKR